MLKLSRNGIGVLSSQYRSVLKKCAFLNMIAAGMLAFASQAQAAHVTGVNSPGHELDELKGMGTTVGRYEGTTPVGTYGKLYITGSMADTNTKEMFSANNTSAGWLVNYNTVFIGTQPQDPDNPESPIYIDVPATISDKHNILSSVSSVTPSEGGGVIRNDTDTHSGSAVGGRVAISGSTFQNNSVTNFLPNNLRTIAAGGVISNVGIYNASYVSNYVSSINSTYINNYTMQFRQADGGAVYNGVAVGGYGSGVFIGKYLSKGDTYQYNHTGNEDMKTSIYNVVRDAVSGGVNDKITADWNNNKTGTSFDGMSTYARGGAIFNAGEFTIESDTFKNNYVIGHYAYGGAIYNTDRQYPWTDTADAIRSDDGHLDILGTTIFMENSALVKDNEGGAARGGAIANEGTTLNFNTGIIAEVPTRLTFKDNWVESNYQSYGGAIYNGTSLDTDPKDGVINNINHATFDGNYAVISNSTTGFTNAWGGAIYNDGSITILDATFTNNYVMNSGTNSSDTSYGGAIDNNRGTVKFGVFDTTLGYQPEDIIFRNNRAGISYDEQGNEIVAKSGQGGAIYNIAGKIEGNIEKSVIFSGNRDLKTHASADRLHQVSSAGGAIYGDVGEVEDGRFIPSETTFNLSGTGSVRFENYGQDNVYMQKFNNYSAVISFIGDNSIPVERNSSSATTSSVDENATRVDLGATFTGLGKYVIKQTQLNLIDGVNGAGTGYIYFDPSITMQDSVVNMGGTGNSYIYLTSQNDTLENNDFYLENKKAVLYYGDYDSTYRNFTLGNYIENNGLIIYDDKPQNGIAGKMYPGETTSGDTDIKIATTLINRGIVTTASDNFITKNVHIGTLESENGAIYINMDNDHLIRGDNEHVLVPEEKEGYNFGTYFGDHYESEVIVIDKAVKGTTKITLVDLESNDYQQIKLDESQRIYFAKTQYDEGLEGYQWNVVNAVNDDYKISIGYDQNGSVYDWFLYRGSAAPVPGITPEEMVSITIPRATLEQLRSFRFPLDKTNRGQCSCYKDNCDNSFCQYEQGSPKTRLWATPFYRQGTFEKPFDTDFKLFGIDAGVDFQPTTTDLIGVFGSYRHGKYENDGNQKHYGDPSYYFSEQGGEFELKSMSAGLYYRKYIDKLYLMGAVYAGKLDGDIKADNGVKGSIKGKHLGVQAEVGYDIKLTRRDTLTPSVRGTYDYIKYNKGHTSNGKEISIGKINSFEIEAALKLEHQFNNSQQLPTTGYVKPSIIQTIPDGGKVKVDDREYKKTLDNETLGRIEVGADANLTTSFSVGVFGNYTFGSHYDAWGVGGNVRYTF